MNYVDIPSASHAPSRSCPMRDGYVDSAGYLPLYLCRSRKRNPIKYLVLGDLCDLRRPYRVPLYVNVVCGAPARLPTTDAPDKCYSINYHAPIQRSSSTVVRSMLTPDHHTHPSVRLPFFPPPRPSPLADLARLAADGFPVCGAAGRRDFNYPPDLRLQTDPSWWYHAPMPCR